MLRESYEETAHVEFSFTAMNVPVGLYARISATASSNFTKFFTHVAYGRGSILLRWRCNMLITSGFSNDVMLSYNGPIGDVTLRQQLRLLHGRPIVCVMS